jgi:DNA-binding response OmpR family regulator
MCAEELSLPGYRADQDPAESESVGTVTQPASAVVPATSTDQAKSALLVSPSSEDHEFLSEIFVQQKWTFYGVRTLGSALALLREQRVPVVITERDLPLGDWKDLLAAIQHLAHRPLLVASRIADEYLWTEVLNLGGHDVLAKPFQAKELRWVLESAWRIPIDHKKHPVKSASVAVEAKAS